MHKYLPCTLTNRRVPRGRQYDMLWMCEPVLRGLHLRLRHGLDTLARQIRKKRQNLRTLCISLTQPGTELGWASATGRVTH